MSRSTPNRRMTCSKCRERDTYRVLMRAGSYNPTWFNIVAVSRYGRKVLCECRTCGHTYSSGSIAAHRSMEYIERMAHNNELTGTSLRVLGEVCDGLGRETETIDRLFLELSQFTKARTEREIQLDKLLYAVQQKFPGETRFETALRYIRRMEEPSDCRPTKMTT